MRPAASNAVPLVGRTIELDALPPFLDAVAAGSRTLVFEGEAGIGKTALWLAGVELGRERGCRILSCRPGHAETQLAFAALSDLLTCVSDESLAALPEPQRRALDVALLRTDAAERGVDRRSVSQAVLEVFRTLSVVRPLLLAIDDLQWLDTPSAAALQFALRRLQAEPVALLATRRQPGGESVSRFLDAIPVERLQRLEVGPLDRDSLADLLLQRSRLRLTPPALLQLHRISAGNPFLALETARALERREVDVVPGEAFPVPQNLRELVRDRLEQLAPEALRIALIVASLSRPTVERVEEAAVGWGEEADGLGQALAAGIVEIEARRVRFTHPLLGSIVYSDASPARRRELHARLAGFAQDSEEKAWHLALATVTPDAAVARALDKGAATALRRGAPETAAQLLEHARRLTPTSDAREASRRTLEAADSHLKAGDARAARGLLSELAEETRFGGVRARALASLGGVMFLEHDWRAAADLWRQALRETEDPETRGHCEEGLGWAEWFGGDLRSAIPHMRRAVSLAEEAGNRVMLAELLGEQAFLEGMLGERRTDHILDQALTVAEQAAPIRMLRQPHRWLPPLVMWNDELDRAREIVSAEHAKAVEAGDEHVLANIFDGLTDVERLAGNLEASAGFAEEMHRAAVLTGQVFMRALALSKQGLVHGLQGRVEDCRARAAEGLALAEGASFLHPQLGCLHALGALELSLGDSAAAEEYLGRVVRAAAAAGIGEPGAARFVPDAVEALVSLGRLAEAEAVLRPFEERAAALSRRWAVAAAQRCRALLLCAGGHEIAKAHRLAVEAVAQHESVGQPYELARTLLVQGQLLRRAKRKAAARAALERAGTIFDALGAPLWSMQASAELALTGGRTRRTKGLTPTEERVAELAGAGRTNREIAAELFLSVNTVQAYLKRIYRELRVRSRTELARALLPGERANDPDSGLSSRPPRS